MPSNKGRTYQFWYKDTVDGRDTVMKSSRQARTVPRLGERAKSDGASCVITIPLVQGGIRRFRLRLILRNDLRLTIFLPCGLAICKWRLLGVHYI